MIKKQVDRNLNRLVGSLLLMVSFSCAKPATDESSSSSSGGGGGSSRYLYVASGLCYSGGGNTTFTTATSSNVVYRVGLSSGVRDSTIADYLASPSQAGDSPVGIESIDSEYLYVLVENATAGNRRVDKVEKKSSGNRLLFTNTTTALSAVVRSFSLLSNGDLLISKGSAIERISSSNVRITKGANPYVSAPAAPCATSTTLMSQVGVLSNQYILFLHAAASQNRFGFVLPAGYGGAGDCTPAQAAPNVNAYPVAYAYDSDNSKLIVAYAGNSTATDLNSIYVYDLTETVSSVTVGAANKIYDSNLYPATYPYLLYGISAMTYDPVDKHLYVATATTTATTVVNYAIEKFSYDVTKVGTANTSVLTRVGNTPFYPYGGDTKCIADLKVAN